MEEKPSEVVQRGQETKILLIEDHFIVSMFQEQDLIKSGYKVIVGTTFSESDNNLDIIFSRLLGILNDLFSEKKFELVILDPCLMKKEDEEIEKCLRPDDVCKIIEKIKNKLPEAVVILLYPNLRFRSTISEEHPDLCFYDRKYVFKGNLVRIIKESFEKKDLLHLIKNKARVESIEKVLSIEAARFTKSQTESQLFSSN